MTADLNTFSHLLSTHTRKGRPEGRPFPRHRSSVVKKRRARIYLVTVNGSEMALPVWAPVTVTV